MYAFASELFWGLTDPARSVLAVSLIGTVLLWTRWRRLGRWLVTIAAAAIFAVAVLPMALWVATPLEGRFPHFEDSGAPIDGIIVLGSGAAFTSKLTGLPAAEASGERLVKLIELARKHPEARLVYTGGGTPLTTVDAAGMTEAQIAKRDLGIAGFDTSRMVFEDRSLNTYDNAVFTKPLVNPQPGERWVLITSAIHMPRAVAAFRAAGWDVTPAPVEYLFRASNFALGFEPVRRFNIFSRVTHEWVGLVVYRLLGRSHELLPAP